MVCINYIADERTKFKIGFSYSKEYFVKHYKYFPFTFVSRAGWSKYPSPVQRIIYIQEHISTAPDGAEFRPYLRYKKGKLLGKSIAKNARLTHILKLFYD